MLAIEGGEKVEVSLFQHATCSVRWSGMRRSRSLMRP